MAEIKVKERPIIFNSEMVKAILDGSKTQSRRVLKPQPDLGLDPFESYSHIEVGHYHPTEIDKNGEEYPGDEIFGAYTDDGEWGWRCPFGEVGDRLWVRETHYCYGKWWKNGITQTGLQRWRFHPIGQQVAYLDNPPTVILKGKSESEGWYKRPSIFMPRWASRILLEITDIRVERLGKITLADIYKEGIDKNPFTHWTSHQRKFEELWNSPKTKRGYSWEVNPWVWVISF